jgi:hypothetical protein
MFLGQGGGYRGASAEADLLNYLMKALPKPVAIQILFDHYLKRGLFG